MISWRSSARPIYLESIFKMLLKSSECMTFHTKIRFCWSYVLTVLSPTSMSMGLPFYIFVGNFYTYSFCSKLREHSMSTSRLNFPFRQSHPLSYAPSGLIVIITNWTLQFLNSLLPTFSKKNRHTSQITNRYVTLHILKKFVLELQWVSH